MMDKAERIQRLEKEIEQFDYSKLKKMELAQHAQQQLQRDLSDIHDGMLTRRGEIICLQRLIAREKKDESNPT